MINVELIMENKMNRLTLSFSVLLVVIIIISGCGGGGGEHGSLSGTVTDVAGNLIPGATIYLDDRAAGTSLMNGTFKIRDIEPGYHNVEASVKINGKTWTGTRELDVYSDGPTMNMNVVVGAWDNLGVIEGAVTNLNNNPLPNARVIAIARYPQDKPASEASVISKVTVTNEHGEYSITDLPASITVNGIKQDMIYDVVASFAGESGEPGGYNNVTKTATISSDVNKVTIVDFKLEASDMVSPPTPDGWTGSDAIYVLSYTVPIQITTRAAQSVYDAVKSCISERSSKAVALKRRMINRSAPSGSLIENDVVWYSIWNSSYGIDMPTNLAGFSIYRGRTSQLERTSQYQIDFVRDPSIVMYADTADELSAGVRYWYGVTSVSTSYLDADNHFNQMAESAMSGVASVVPLGKLIAQLPQDHDDLSAAQPVFRWLPVSGAKSYKVFVYESYPVVDSMFTPQGDPERPDHLPAWGESQAVTGSSVQFNDPNFSLSPGHTYWWVVMAADDVDFDMANAYSISELRSFIAR